MSRLYRFKRRLRHYLRRAAYASSTRVFRNASRYRGLSFKRRRYGWTSSRHSKSVGLIRRYSRSRQLTGAEIKYFNQSNVAYTWALDYTRAYSPLFPPVISGSGHKIRIVYIEVSLVIPNGVPCRVIIVRHKLASPASDTQSGNPFSLPDSPLSTNTTSTSQFLSIAFNGFYSQGSSGNIQVIYDKLFNVLSQGSSPPTRYFKLTFGRGYTCNFIDSTSKYGRNRFQICLMYATSPGDQETLRFNYRIAYTNVGG